MSQTTYSFLDSVLILAHPAEATPFVFVGEGTGSITVSMSETRTIHDIAADGSVMVTKVAGNNGQISIDVQQTSNAHRSMLAFFNRLIQAPPDQWAQATLAVRNITDHSGHLCTGISPQKVPDKVYKKEGGHVTWVLLAADIQSSTF